MFRRQALPALESQNVQSKVEGGYSLFLQLPIVGLPTGQ